MENTNMYSIYSENNLNSQEKSVTELEAENHFGDYVAAELDRLHETALADLVREKKISIIKLEVKKVIMAGNQQENFDPDKFNVGEFIKMRAEITAKELTENKRQYLN